MATYRINSIYQCNNSVFDGGSIIVVLEVLTYQTKRIIIETFMLHCGHGLFMILLWLKLLSS